jgi:4-amino-4-deoxy-L-arabinose transferase-like glycosyltransferase
MHADSDFDRRERILLGAILLAYTGFVLLLGLGRPYLGYGVESDFIGVSVPEARRFLDGQPLQGQFHPPFYAMAVGALYYLLQNWLLVGVLFSALSGLAVLTTTYLLFSDLCGKPAAWGAVATLLGSSVFLQYSATASTDIFFLALFMGCCLLAIKALPRNSKFLWSGCGLLAGLAILTRSNGLTLGLLLLVPFLAPQVPMRARLANALCVAAGLAAPVLALQVYASATGSNVWPSRNHLNLAMTYFSTGDRTSLESWQQVKGRFGSFTDVLLYDPPLLIKSYLRDLYDAFGQGLTRLVEPPLSFLFLPGLLFLLAGRFKIALGALLVVVAAQVLLVNFKAFQPRFYLVLVPLMGAGVGETAWRLLQVRRDSGWPKVAKALLGMMLVTAVTLAGVRAYRYIAADVDELIEVIPVAEREIGEWSIVLARKDHISFYTGSRSRLLPDLANLDELHQFLQQHDFHESVYLFYGQQERQFRPQYQDLQHRGSTPDWLSVVGESSSPGRWVLYRYARG